MKTTSAPLNSSLRVNSDTQANLNVLAWHCRRGMLELDLLLNSFLHNKYQELELSARQAFEQLLEYPDAVLYDLLMGHSVTADQEIADVVKKIRTKPAD